MKIGNIVRLKSGGPDMTVLRVTKPNSIGISLGLPDEISVSCAWHDDNYQISVQSFPVEALIIHKED